MTETAVAVIDEKQTDLSVSLTVHALSALREQRSQLKGFIETQLQKKSDYDVIPGTQKPSLLKPGAEKLLNIFKLGSRIVKTTANVDPNIPFVMYSYTIEVFHIATGLAISQCEGSANSKEKKFKSRDPFDLMNTLQKMAQKRAFVGAAIMATGASDFFTQDMEDMALEKSATALPPDADTPSCENCGAEMKVSKNGDRFFCPNWQDKSKGDHPTIKI